MAKEYVVGKDDKGNAIVVDPDLEYTKSGVMIAGLTGLLLGGVSVGLYTSRKLNRAVSTLVEFKELVTDVESNLKSQITDALAAAKVEFGTEIQNKLKATVDNLKSELGLSLALLRSDNLSQDDIGALFDVKIAPIVESISQLIERDGINSAATSTDTHELLSAFKVQLMKDMDTRNQELRDSFLNAVESKASSQQITQLLTQLGVLEGLVRANGTASSITEVYNNLFDAMKTPEDSSMVGSFLQSKAISAGYNSLGELTDPNIMEGDELLVYGGRLFKILNRAKNGSKVTAKHVNLSDYSKLKFLKKDGSEVDYVKLVLKNESIASSILNFDNYDPYLYTNQSGIDGSTHFNEVIYGKAAFFSTAVTPDLPFYFSSDEVEGKVISGSMVKSSLYVRSLGSPDSSEPGNNHRVFKRQFSLNSAGRNDRDILAATLHRSMRDHSFAWVIKVVQDAA